MAKVLPFKAYRPRTDIADRVAALPYDVYDREEALLETEREPLSFLCIDRPETQFPPDQDMYADEVYDKARELLKARIDEGIFVQDEEESYYLYEQEMDGRIQTGIVGCASVDDYISGVVKKHENTLEAKERDRIRHVDTCSMQTGPIFLCYRDRADLRSLMENIKTRTPLYSFTTGQGIGTRVWKTQGAEEVLAVKRAFEDTDCLYIADGHHRCASAVKVALMRRERTKDEERDKPFDSFLSVIFPDSDLKIMDYNRLVRDLNGLTVPQFLDRISSLFTVTEAESAVKPAAKGEFGMFLDGRWYRLRADESIRSNDPVRGLDVSILQDHVLYPILGIEDPKTDKRIAFVGGIRGLEELERRCSQDMKLAFSMYPTDISELFAVADAGLLMPPKSTWFEPKLLSGLFLHDIS